MSTCADYKDYPPAPNYMETIQGSYSIIHTTGSHMPDNDYSSEIKQIWARGCTDDNVFYTESEGNKSIAEVDEGFDLYSFVECRIGSEEKWKEVWESIQLDDANPNNFLYDPIEWTRFELSSLIKKSVQWWLGVDDPFVGDYGSGATKDAGQLQSNLVETTAFTAGVIAVVSLLFVAARMALRRDAQPAKDTFRGLVTLVVVTAGSLTFIKFLLNACDKFTQYFILRTLPPGSLGAGTDPNNPKYCTAIQSRIAQIPAQFDQMNFFLFVLCSVFLLVASVVVYFYMLGRVFVITLLAGLMPLAAAGTATEAGKEWFGKMVSYVVAFIFVKPAATVIYVVGLRLSDPGDGVPSDVMQFSSAGFLLFGTVLLPAMTRLAFPFTSAAAQGDRAAQALAMAPVAVGAKVVKSGISTLR